MFPIFLVVFICLLSYWCIAYIKGYWLMNKIVKLTGRNMHRDLIVWLEFLLSPHTFILYLHKYKVLTLCLSFWFKVFVFRFCNLIFFFIVKSKISSRLHISKIISYIKKTSHNWKDNIEIGGTRTVETKDIFVF